MIGIVGRVISLPLRDSIKHKTPALVEQVFVQASSGRGYMTRDGFGQSISIKELH
jgi:hypothetical protein